MRKLANKTSPREGVVALDDPFALGGFSGSLVIVHLSSTSFSFHGFWRAAASNAKIGSKSGFLHALP